jgi:hypothetical protein
MVPIRAVPTKTFITVFIVNSNLAAANIFLRNAEYKDCGLGLRNGVTVMWLSRMLLEVATIPRHLVTTASIPAIS